MRISIPVIVGLTSGIVHAQSAMNMISDSMMSCQIGYTASLTCEDPVPESCTCLCRDGSTFNQSRPPITDPIPGPPSLENPIPIEGTPCTTKIIQKWKEIVMSHKAYSFDPSEKKTVRFNAKEECILVVADSSQICQHFEVYIDDQMVARTNGTAPLNGEKCGKPEICINEGASHGYFRIPKGEHSIGLRWVDITEECNHLPNAVGSYQIYQPC